MKLISKGGIEFRVQYETACNYSLFRTLPGAVDTGEVSTIPGAGGRFTIAIPVEVVEESITNRFFTARSDASSKPGTKTTCLRCLLPSDFADYGLVPA